MANFSVSVRWKRTTDDFSPDTYNRDHQWVFSDRCRLEASAAPEYKGNAELANPEQGLAAALSSCHMLTFLALAARKGLSVDAYEDKPSGELGKNRQGRMAVTRVTLRPRVRFAGEGEVEQEVFDELHEKAHQHCFIANSVSMDVTVEPTME